MRSLIQSRWRNSSIAHKLYFVVGIMAVLISVELLTLRFAVRHLSAVRAFVEGEGTWSKAQKNAAFSLQRYGATRQEEDYQAFLNFLTIPEGDHQARVELLKPNPDLNLVRQGFLRGQIHPDDIGPMIDLLQRFYWISYLSRAIALWSRGDELMKEFKEDGQTFHRLLNDKNADPKVLHATMAHLSKLNDDLTQIEAQFSNALGEGSRWLERIVVSVLFFAVLLVETIGLTLTFLTSRMISRGLSRLNMAADKIGHGNFTHRLEVQSVDEIGMLSASVNKMGDLLQKSYGDLERRVAERTVELSTMAAENVKLYEEARAAVIVREDFLSIASHELKTPLTSQCLQLELLLMQIRSAPETPHLLKIKDLTLRALSSAKRQAVLVDKLMDVTRLRAGKFETSFELCDLTAIIRDVITMINPSASRSGNIEFRSEGPIYLEMDPTRIGQVITNLISNAKKYGNGQLVFVEAKANSSEATVVVKDSGRGIAPSEQEKIFGRFERILGDKNISGLGLGLYITRQIIEAHGGTISLESEEGKGSTFSIVLPLQRRGTSS